MSLPRTPPRLGVLHCTMTGATTLAILVLLLWVGTAIAGPTASEGMLVFLTQQSLTTPARVGLALGYAVLFGSVIGAVIALTYNALRFLHRP